MTDDEWTMNVVGRRRPLIDNGETITTNAGHIRLEVYEGRVDPTLALEALDRIGGAQTKAHGEREYRRGFVDGTNDR